MRIFHLHSLICILIITILCSCKSNNQLLQEETQCLADIDSLVEKLNEYPILSSGKNIPLSDQSGDSPPGDNEDIDVLLDYWLKQPPMYDKQYPSRSVLTRLFEYGADKPGLLEILIALIPEELQYDEELIESIHTIYKNNMEYFKDSFIADYLMLRSGYFRDQLLEKAYSCEFGNYLKNDEYVHALITLDLPAAIPVLEYYLESEDKNVSTFALSELYKIYVGKNNSLKVREFRNQLKRIGEDKNQPGFSRQYAIRTLLETEWDGMEDWYLSLFKDESLMNVLDGMYMYSPLGSPVRADPDYWIPVISKLVKHENKAIHNNAVIVLQQFNLEDARADALRPLVPWLSDPDWAKEPFHPCRLRIVQSLDRVSVPESIPGLIWILENEYSFWKKKETERYKEEEGKTKLDEKDQQKIERTVRNKISFCIEAAADALAYYDYKPACPFIRNALSLEISYSHKIPVVSALVRLGGVPVDDYVDCIIKYCRKKRNKGDENFRSWSEHEYPDAWLGAVLSLKGFADKAAAKEIIKLIELYNNEDPGLSASLKKIILSWDLDIVHQYIIDKVLECRIDDEIVLSIFDKRDKIKSRLTKDIPEPAHIRGLHPVQKVLLAAVLHEAEMADVLLHELHDERVLALLISLCRIVQLELPLEKCELLLLKTNEPLLISSILDYLETIGNEAAISIITNYKPDEYMIHGGRMDYDPGHFSFKALDSMENMLIKKIRENDSILEIHALLSAGYWGNKGQRIILCYADHAEYFLLQDNGRKKKCTVRLSALDDFLKFAQGKNIDELPPFTSHVQDGMQYEYLYMNRKFGRRVFMNNPGPAAGGLSVYNRIIDHFYKLYEENELSIYYPAFEGNENYLKYSDETNPVLTVYTDRSGIYLFSEKTQTWETLIDGMVIINLLTGDSKQIDIEWADNFAGICFLDLYDSFLLIRSRDQVDYDENSQGPEEPVHYLFNPYDNSIREADGEFGPLHQQSFRSLQQTNIKNKYWAAIPDYRSDKTELGMYDLTHFKFEKITEFIGVCFNSMDMWVDEENNRLYVVVNGDLVSVLY